MHVRLCLLFCVTFLPSTEKKLIVFNNTILYKHKKLLGAGLVMSGHSKKCLQKFTLYSPNVSLFHGTVMWCLAKKATGSNASCLIGHLDLRSTLAQDFAIRLQKQLDISDI